VSASDEELRRRVAELESQLEAEKAKARKGVQLKVSEKGGVSLYGIRRFPVTFYADEWERILGMADEIRAFVAQHRAELKQK
jgi:hypothetical protein